jgi:hypothetical protein
MSIKFEDCTFSTKWCSASQEYIATCRQFPNLSWLDPVESEALESIKALVREALEEMSI